ncbi:MAG TPA: zinc ribbon domain-containing protein [Anaerolineae bacterium]|nr:zinc ribbon domain-containing protein [Anaerolineae bacterium]HOQ98155.1 zinc ribbon domain-containing protein [Anaerolineae bacterium]HPL29594.1 zinc ribbon domain-containing protein [Anaerolineae bacterium]
MGRFFLRLTWGIARFCWRHLFGVLLVILLVAAALIGYQVWTLGPLMAGPLLPYLGTCLGLIVVVIVLWLLRRSLARLLVKGRLSLHKRAAKEAVRQGVGQGEVAARAAVKGAQGAVSTAVGQLQQGLDRLLGIKPGGAPAQAAPRLCPSCKRLLRPEATFCDRCGARLPTFCQQCGQEVRPKDKTCRHCGARLR